jgi:transmembrane sensor
MKPSPTPPAQAEEQASLWAARLDGGHLSAPDRASLNAWLDADPAHRLLLSAYCQFSADLEQQLPLLAGIGDELSEHRTATKTARLLPRSRWPLWAGVTLTAAAAVAVVLWLHQPQDQFRNVATTVAQRQDLTLADGTHAELNAQTALVVELKADERRVRLAAGEAFFHVARDPSRPFFVETPAGSVRVTGTQFNVRTDPLTGLEVTVLEGAVQVRPGEGSAPRALGAGDQLVSDHGHVAVQALSAAAVGDALAWREGQIVFNGTPLREALGRFARYHGRTLGASDRAAAQRVGGRYAIDDLNGFLAALEEALPVTVVRNLDGSIQVDSVRR